MSRTRSRLPYLSLLEEAGFEQGDFLPLYSFNPPNNFSTSFTSTTYTGLASLFHVKVIWDDILPPGVTSQVLGEIYVSGIGAGETVDLRIQNTVDGETVGEITGITSSYTVFTIGPVDYTPSTTASKIPLVWQWRESPGTNSTEIQIPFISIGVRI